MAQKKETMTDTPIYTPYKPDTADGVLSVCKSVKGFAGDIGALSDRVAQSLAVLQEQGIPTPKMERWKYTNLARAVKNIELSYIAPVYTYDSALVAPLDKASAAKGWVKEMLLATPPQEDKYKDYFGWHMANVFLKDGLVIDIPANTVMDAPLDLETLVKKAGISVSRILINVGENAELTLIEAVKTQETSWLNALVQVNVGKNAKLRHYHNYELVDESVYTQMTHIRIQRDATYEGFAFVAGTSLIRNQIHVEMQGQNGTCNLYGINMLDGSKHADTTITIEHQAPHCNSNQFYRSVLDDTSHGVFQGKVHVHREAQKTDGYQLANTLILSQGAEMDTKPELEIYADDVKCSHGATTGQLDEAALFYLKSRGIPAKEARAILIGAFVREVVEKLADKSMDDVVNCKIARWLEERAV